MPTCQNCGAFVTADYVRVFTPSGVDEPRACIYCEDKIRDGNAVRDARSHRGNEHRSYGEAGQVEVPTTDD